LESLSRDMAAQVSKQTMRIEQKTRSLAILYDVAASINAARDLNDLLTRFLHTLCDLLNARGGVIRLIGEDGQMPLVASTGLDDDLVAQEHFVPSPQCLCSQAAQNGTPLCQDDLHHCAEVIGREFFERDDLGLVAIPLQYRGHTLGVYNLFVGSRDLSERDDLQPLLTSVGRHLGMAIEKTRLDEESKRLSLIEERTRLAHELHDSLAQTLASLRFQVKVLDETLPNDDYPSDEVKRIAGSLDEAHTELRELIAHFRAPVHERGFVPAIEELLERFRNQSGIRVFLQNEWPTAALSPDTATEVLRIIQEALCNVRKHARAHTVRVLLSHDAHRNRHILVEDDGVGMTVPTASNGGDHIGLSIMDERAQRIGARLRIESEPDEGTRLSLTLTCQDEPASLLAARRAAQ
ncbi:MAG: GAF domain-containing protein, partial [Gammaproteobacteria bacterium]|nr:GAF domain-containing protein [Gammaproteobacteria bacterium]NIR85863.1 GAF domain-containing protein [Gammaproteobacteria bacterium]NIU06998.1 GAF domain-containing protein [Gammaproteobacteria bacterium]NIV53913.1 GAF domain-containing protein [Gammaproteobacteria bacterium]NIX88271.1 GAF domain-containing protein [Gammaproteobacteria bacterium]